MTIQETTSGTGPALYAADLRELDELEPAWDQGSVPLDGIAEAKVNLSEMRRLFATFVQSGDTSMLGQIRSLINETVDALKPLKTIYAAPSLPTWDLLEKKSLGFDGDHDNYAIKHRVYDWKEPDAIRSAVSALSMNLSAASSLLDKCFNASEIDGVLMLPTRLELIRDGTRKTTETFLLVFSREVGVPNYRSEPTDYEPVASLWRPLNNSLNRQLGEIEAMANQVNDHGPTLTSYVDEGKRSSYVGPWG